MKLSPIRLNIIVRLILDAMATCIIPIKQTPFEVVSHSNPQV